MVIDNNSILKDTCDLEKYIKSIKTIESHEDQIIQVLKSFLELFPLLDIGLFRYSPFGYLTEGIMAITPEEGLKHIRDMRDDVRTLPCVYNAVRTRRAIFLKGEDFVKYNPRYTFTYKTSSILFIPISFRSVVVGMACSTQFSESNKKIEELLPLFTLFGEMLGELFEEPYLINDNYCLLNKREIEIMQKLSIGETTKIIAQSMHLSEFTIRDYIKLSLKKLGVKDRTHAVAILIKQGII
jgi:DNA-binding CsgD family transcriptional regulator